MTDRLPTGTLVKAYVPEAVRRAAVAAGEYPMHEEVYGYVSHYADDDAIVMVLGGPTISVPVFCVVSAEESA